MTDLLTRVCSIPTAPFAESRVLAFVDQFARRNRMSLAQDEFGNRLLQIGPKAGRRRLVFVAHCDHPGMVAVRMSGPRTLLARFHGGVLSKFVEGTRVRFFDADREIPGRVERITRSSDRADFPAEVEVNVSSPVTGGSAGLFDQGPGRIRGGKFYSRVCDDLAGVAAILEAMRRVDRRKLRTPVAALITRAEEEGFIGAIAAVKSAKLIRRDDRLISVECSAVQPYARQGDGVILRVGDRTSIFHSGFTHWMHQQCEQMAAGDKSFRFQRALMPGGSCEGTVFDAHGYVAAAACVPLGNYHNMNRDTGKIGPEYIDLGDWKSEVKLFAHLMQRGHEVDLKFTGLRRRLNKRFAMMSKHL